MSTEVGWGLVDDLLGEDPLSSPSGVDDALENIALVKENGALKAKIGRLEAQVRALTAENQRLKAKPVDMRACFEKACAPLRDPNPNIVVLFDFVENAPSMKSAFWEMTRLLNAALGSTLAFYLWACEHRRDSLNFEYDSVGDLFLHVTDIVHSSLQSITEK